MRRVSCETALMRKDINLTVLYQNRKYQRLKYWYYFHVIWFMSVHSYQQCSRHSVTLKSRRFGVRNTVAARDVLFSTRVQPNSATPASSCTMGTGTVTRRLRGRRLASSNHPHPPPSFKMSRAIRILPFCACISCYRETFTFTELPTCKTPSAPHFIRCFLFT